MEAIFLLKKDCEKIFLNIVFVYTSHGRRLGIMKSEEILCEKNQFDFN